MSKFITSDPPYNAGLYPTTAGFLQLENGEPLDGFSRIVTDQLGTTSPLSLSSTNLSITSYSNTTPPAIKAAPSFASTSGLDIWGATNSATEYEFIRFRNFNGELLSQIYNYNSLLTFKVGSNEIVNLSATQARIGSTNNNTPLALFGSNSLSAIFNISNISVGGDKTFTFPNANMTFAGIDIAQTFTAQQTFSVDTLILNTRKITNALDASQSIHFTSQLSFNDASKQLYNIAGITRANLTSTGFAIGMTDTTASARLHVRGDGTNDIARFENNSGQNIVSVTNAGTLTFGTFAPFVGIASANGTGTNAINGNTLRLYSNISTTSGYSVNIASINGSTSYTTGVGGTLNLFDNFGAAAGNANFRPLNIAYTINNSGAQTGTATGIFLNATEYALNGMTHNLMDLQVGGFSQFSIMAGNGLRVASDFRMHFNTRSSIYSPADGLIQLTNSNKTDFNRLQFGGTTNAFPSIKRNGTAIDIRLADDSGFANLTAQNVISGGARFQGTGSFVIQSAVDGRIILQNNATTDFGLLQFGGTTSAFPAIKRSSDSLSIRLADDSADASLSAAILTASSSRLNFGGSVSIRSGAGSPEGTITAGVGSLYLNTSGGANTTLYIKESGTGNTGWAAK